MVYQRCALSVFTFLLLILVPGTAVRACPACNIHNYLARTVTGSKNIYVMQVARAVDRERAEVKVIRVLRGEARADETRTIPMYGSADEIGRQWIYCDADDAFGPRFNILPVVLEDEVRFLLPLKEDRRNDAMLLEQDERATPIPVKSADEAVRCLAGVSYVTRQCGVAYAKAHSEEVTAETIAAIGKLQAAMAAGNPAGTRFGRFSLEGLLNGICAANTAEGKAFLVAEVKRVAALPAEAGAVPAEPPIFCAWQGQYLSDLLRQAESDPAHQANLKSQLVRLFPKMSDSARVHAVYALLDSGLMTPDNIVELADDRPSDACAIGLMQAASHKLAWLNRKDARPMVDKAAGLARSAEVKQAVATMQSRVSNRR